jgi:carbamoyl-phosphate synthase large subunit
MLTSKVPLILCFDIDETLCTSPGIDYELAMPINERIVKVNSLYAEGHTIKLYTARGSKTGKDLRVLTENQLNAWGLNYHELAFGKPFADFYIDDKAINSDNFDWA